MVSLILQNGSGWRSFESLPKELKQWILSSLGPKVSFPNKVLKPFICWIWGQNYSKSQYLYTFWKRLHWTSRQEDLEFSTFTSLWMLTLVLFQLLKLKHTSHRFIYARDLFISAYPRVTYCHRFWAALLRQMLLLRQQSYEARVPMATVAALKYVSFSKPHTILCYH